jgi:hypothetical protein
MITRRFLGLAVSLLGLGGASCSSPDLTPACTSGNGLICAPAALPFVVSAGTRSDACSRDVGTPCPSPASPTTAALDQPEPGKLCMKGSVVAGGFAWLLVGMSAWDRTRTNIVGVFDARALGIEALSFTIDRPPSAGMSLFATTAVARFCAMPSLCLEEWDLMTGPRTGLVKVIKEPGTVSAPFTDFERQTAPNDALDASAIGHFIFVLGAGDYDFCISDFKFVDGQGAEVVPPATADAGAPQG